VTEIVKRAIKNKDKRKRDSWGRRTRIMGENKGDKNLKVEGQNEKDEGKEIIVSVQLYHTMLLFH